MRNLLITYLLIMLGYWFKLIWTLPAGYSKAYLLGRAFVCKRPLNTPYEFIL